MSNFDCEEKNRALELQLAHQQEIIIELQSRYLLIPHIYQNIHDLYHYMNIISLDLRYILGKVPKEDDIDSRVLKISEAFEKLRWLLQKTQFNYKRNYRLDNLVPLSDCVEETVENTFKLRNCGFLPIIEINSEIGSTLVSSDVSIILTNLVNNALDAVYQVKNKEELIVISAKAHQSESYVEIRVDDNGTGILQKHKNQIWDSTFSTKLSDFGLGLFIAKKMVENLKGSISIEKSTFGGACFMISLPVTSERIS